MSAKHISLNDVLSRFRGHGYRIADASVAAMPSEAIQSNDWRLDKLEQVLSSDHSDTRVAVIAVSSRRLDMKLLFVEVLYPGTEYRPIQLLRRLFPQRRNSRLQAPR